MSFINLGGVSPIGPRARRRLRSPVTNPVTKVSGGMGGARLAGGTFQRGAAPGRGGGFRGGFGRGRGRGGRGHRGRRRHRGGGFFPYYYPYYYPYYSLYPYYGYGYGGGGYGYQQQERETVPSACCYNVQTGSLYCPGSEYDGAPAFAEATRLYQGRQMSYVTSPQLGQAQWFWNCPTQAEPSAIVPGVGSIPPRAPSRRRRSARLR